MEYQIVLFFVFFTVFTWETQCVHARSYSNYQLLRVEPVTLGQVRFLRELSLNGRYDFWKESRGVGHPADIMVHNDEVTAFKEALTEKNIHHHQVMKDVGRQIKSLELELRSTVGDFWSSYQRMDDIYDYVRGLEKQHSDIVKVEEYGQSQFGRSLLAVTVGRGGKPIILIDGGIHAREWVAVSTALYVLHKLVESPELLVNFTWKVIPVVNPDGYEYSHTTDRMWRKTVSPSSSGSKTCIGVDANRNFGFKWGMSGASSDPCSGIYMGPQSFSERETRALRSFGLSHKGNIKAYLTLHSYGQYWFTPWGFSSKASEKLKDMPNLISLAKRATEAIFRSSGRRYAFGPSSTLLYEAAGGSDDWMRAKVGVKYSYTVELRDKGEYGFLLPASQITETGEEFFAALKEVATFLQDH